MTVYHAIQCIDGKLNMNEPGESPAPREQPQSPQKPKRFNPATVKVVLIAFVFGLLQIPLYLILGTIEERQTFNVQYPQDYQGPGPGQQTIVGPILTIPYQYQVIEEKQIADDSTVTKNGLEPAQTVKLTRTETSFMHLFPDHLAVNGNLIPEIRDGGKFKSIIYSSEIEFKGKFDTSEIAQRKIKDSDVMWREAFITLGVSDLRGIRKESTLTWNGRHFRFTPGTNGLTLLEAGQHAILDDLQKSGTYPFSFTLHLNGNHQFDIFPAGKENKIALTSTWKDPTFTGGYLPSHKNVGKNGFNAEWEVSYFNRNFPQLWTDRDPDLKNSLAQYMVGVTLATPVEFYRTTVRAVKYGCLFIIMPFLMLFIFEIITKVRIHEMQYLLVGLALSLFFLMLIAISEYIPFVWAYIIASTATIAQITWYTRAFSKARSPLLWKIMAGTLSLLYGYLYVLLHLEDMSLLFGAIGLFIALTVVLYTTRNIDWHNQTADQKQAA